MLYTYQPTTTAPTCGPTFIRTGLTIIRVDTHTGNCICVSTPYSFSASYVPPAEEFRCALQGWPEGLAARAIVGTPIPPPRPATAAQAARWREYARRRVSMKIDRAPPILAAA